MAIKKKTKQKTALYVFLAVLFAFALFILLYKKKSPHPNSYSKTQIQTTPEADLTIGCGDVQAYKFRASDHTVLSVQFSRKELGITSIPKTFRLKDHPEILVNRLTGVVAPTEFCTDVIMPNAPQPHTVQAIDGEITVSTVTEIPADYPICKPYDINISVTNLHFKGDTLILPSESMHNLTVGWCAG